MKQHTFFILFVIFFYACGNPPAPVQYSNNGIAYQPFPQGYGYLKDTVKLATAVQQSDVAYVREHGWELWAGIEQQADSLDWPVWYTWPTTYQAFADSPVAATAALTAKAKTRTKSLITVNSLHFVDTTSVNLNTPTYPIPPAVIAKYSAVITDDSTNIITGNHFLFNGDIMIPTESLSIEGFDWIRNYKLYKQATLDSLYKAGAKEINAPQPYIVTKHMFWPVLAGQLGVIPVWNEDYPETYTQYAGYETWKSLVAVATDGKQVGDTATVTYLYGVIQIDGKPMQPITKKATIHGINEFYYHKVTQADWDTFDESDKAIINASSYWAYNKPFGPGDYLLTIAMHVNTKEVPTWALQSAWWSNTPDEGIYAQNRPKLPSAKGPWAHYKLVDAYGIPDPATKLLPVGTNPYIELVIHPIATNCNNCHIRAGYPGGKLPGLASYQNPDCNNLLDTLNGNSPCLSKYLRTDFQWLIPDHAN